MAGLCLCTSHGWTPLGPFWFFLCMLPSVTCPLSPLSFKALWQSPWGWPYARVQLDSVGQDGLFSDVWLPLKLPPLLHNCLALPWANRPTSWGWQSYPFLWDRAGTCGRWALSGEHWRPLSSGFPLPSPSFLFLFRTSCLCSTEIQNQAPVYTPLPSEPQPTAVPGTGGSWSGRRSALRGGVELIPGSGPALRHPYGALASSCNSLLVPSLNRHKRGLVSLRQQCSHLQSADVAKRYRGPHPARWPLCLSKAR